MNKMATKSFVLKHTQALLVKSSLKCISNTVLTLL